MNSTIYIEGVGVQINGSVQAAIDQASAAYRCKYNQPPTHISLPGYLDPAALKLYTLQLAAPTCRGATRTKHPGTVIVGRLVTSERSAA